jgi:hypothetical protein
MALALGAAFTRSCVLRSRGVHSFAYTHQSEIKDMARDPEGARREILTRNRRKYCDAEVSVKKRSARQYPA